MCIRDRNDIERVGDHAVNMGNFASYRAEKRIDFSDEAKSELADLFRRVDAIQMCIRDRM